MPKIRRHQCVFTTRDDVGDRARLRNLALGNLNRLLPKIQMRPGADGVSLITADGVYDASLLLADALWSSGQIEVEGDIVVAAPAKGPLLVTGSRNRAGIARLRARGGRTRRRALWLDAGAVRLARRQIRGVRREVKSPPSMGAVRSRYEPK